jgi:hypothetical protein
MSVTMPPPFDRLRDWSFDRAREGKLLPQRDAVLWIPDGCRRVRSIIAPHPPYSNNRFRGAGLSGLDASRSICHLSRRESAPSARPGQTGDRAACKAISCHVTSEGIRLTMTTRAVVLS